MDKQLVKQEVYATLATQDSIDRVVEGFKGRNFDALIVDNKQQALEKIKELIPKGASVMNGSSTTLEEIGFIDYLKSGEHGWNNLHATILAEKDPAKQALLRKQSLASDFYLGSVHGLTEEGEMLIASNTGSQMPNIVYGSQNLILVVGSQKITKDMPAAMERLNDYVIPLEDARMKKAFGIGTNHSKTLIYHSEAKFNNRKILVMIVKEVLGF